ncbi:styrene monooxygenase/indole monooxygenase family protein [Prauserella muralis]|uniref:Oxygenase n=1 Tax=Prauserella muralis TaxID=588067 RepID=A0A2V4AFV7_9PSEU|nr:styrene monooxygenase/indole monooxygenase family protein [Prauserella muralis]PXY18812.1 oxygenase [Prauserella muralis]TWE28663.1 2-polyprenyl-6-methoxyphenol hydroxylase-like FAD-dependent oxidoreductase [Prauserella muralis]
MRSIAIIGAGQGGLQLAFGLLRDGYEVTVYSDRTPEQIATSRLPSSAGLFGRALDRERSLGICFWDGEQPLIEQTFAKITDPEGNVAVAFAGRFAQYGQSVDQRLKFSTWLEAFAGRGGKVVYGEVGLAGLDEIAAANDLTIVAAGKGDIAKIFATDPARMTYERPQRSIGMIALVGTEHPCPDGVSYNIRPGVGEAFGIPMLTAAGPAVTWVMEALPGGPMDRWSQATTAEEMLELTKRTFADFFPWEVDRYAGARISDPNGWLCGAVPPLVREPIATLPSGRTVVGMADVLVLNDPCCGQGANNASAHAAVMHQLILDRGSQPFDEPWMRAAFDRFWEQARHPTRFTNTMLAFNSPGSVPPQHATELLATAVDVPEVANRFCNAFNDPSDLENFFYDPALTSRFLTEARERHELRLRGRAGLAAVGGTA